MTSDFQGQVAAALTGLAARGRITGLEVHDAALGDPGLTDMMFELDGEPLLVMISERATDKVRVVGACREVDVPLDELERTLKDWRT